MMRHMSIKYDFPCRTEGVNVNWVQGQVNANDLFLLCFEIWFRRSPKVG